jgi:ABC-type multidrug transport system fused ATPase/permease subunit
MLKSLTQEATADPYSARNLIHRLVAEYGLKNWRGFAVVILMMSVGAACTAASAYLVGHIVNEAYVSHDLLALTVVSVVAILVSTVKGLSSYFQAVSLARIGNRIIATNQRRMFEKVLRQDLAFFADRHSSEFTARITFGANSASNTLNILVTTLGRDALSLVGLAGVMVFQSPVLALLALLIFPPSVLIVRGLIKRVRRIAQTEFSATAQILQALQEAVQGFRIVEAFNLHDRMLERVNSSIDSIEHAGNRLARASNLSSPLMESLGGVAVASLLLLGGYRVLTFGAPPGEFVSFITAFLLAYEPAKRIARLNVDLGNALVGVRVLFELLDIPDRPDDSAKPVLCIGKGRVEFRDVAFVYRPDTPVLRGISFSAEPGCLTALVGASGGGKSTILNLLLRFYEPYSGSILIDGTEISTVSRRSLRDHMAYVGQDAFLFRGTIRENIALGRPDSSEADIVAAAKAASADEFIMQFPDGYDTQVGEHGMQLSGGQRQRISVARALIRKASIILLDEPTASLDGETEHYVHMAISQLFARQTRLVVAHRLHTIVEADRIIVIDEGRVAESGGHQSLMQDGGRYARFFNLQFAPRNETRALKSRAVVEMT